MTTDRDIERVLDHWFTERPTQVADRVLDEVADRIGRQGQRPAWRLQAWRFPNMSTPMKLLAAGAALLAALVGGAVFLGGGAAPSPSPSPTPTLASSPIDCEDGLPGCAGTLSRGSHRSTNLVPPLKYETADGLWANVIDVPDVYKIDSMSDPTPGSPYIIVWTNASIADQEVSCSTDPDPTRGRAAADWIELVTTHPGLESTDPVEFSIGGRPARQVELSIAADWTLTCPDHTGPYVTLLTQRVEDQVAEYGVPSDERLLLTVVDIGNRTVVIQSYGPTDATEFDRTMGPIRAIIDSFVMCGPAVGVGPCSGPGAPPPIPSVSVAPVSS
jgi:hypothetical protein